MDDLIVAVGLASETGRRPDNQDFCAAHPGSPAERASHGALAVMADGVGGAKGGRIAAELVCRQWIEAYLCQPPTLGVALCAERALAPFNRWLHRLGRTDPAMAGAATTFAAVVVRGRTAHALHAGDSRVWHFRAGLLTCLTDDHALTRPGMEHVLHRAVGLEDGVRLDRCELALADHDRLLLTTDGVHASLSAAALGRLLDARGAPDQAAAAIVAAALAAGSADNASAVVIDVMRLPRATAHEIAAGAASLPIPHLPKAGDQVDGFRLDGVLSRGRTSRAFRATAPDGTACVLKFPDPAVLDDPAARRGFVREALIGALLHHANLAETLPQPPDRQTRLYLVQRHIAGDTLQARLARGPVPLAVGIAIAVGLARGVAALHRRGIIHRDINPANVILAAAGGSLRPVLIDLGAARLPQLDDAAGDVPGTPGYLAPELFDGAQGDAASDQFALGVTLYRLFTGTDPYGQAEAFVRPRFARPADPGTIRPDVPAWLSATLLRMVALRPDERFDDLQEVLDVLEGGRARATPRPGAGRREPWATRHPVAFWQLVSALLAAGLLGALAWHGAPH